MLSSSKIVFAACVIYTMTMLLPALFGEAEKISPHYVQLTVVACMLFLAGMACGGLVAPLRNDPGLRHQAERLRPALTFMTCALALVAVYIFAWGPRSPIVEAVLGADTQTVSLLREDAIKFNKDLVFVRIYTWARDFFAPVVFTLAIAFLTAKPRPRGRAIGFVGLGLAVLVGLWSGQKATIVYYLVATYIVLSAHARALALSFVKLLPIALVFIVGMFAITQPDLFTVRENQDEATKRLTDGIIHRIIVSPLELAGLYIYAVDELEVLRPTEVLPIIGDRKAELGSVENRMSDEYWGDDATVTGHANGPAFAYAYVLGRLIGCFAGGFLAVVVLGLLVRIIRRSGLLAAALVFEAYIAYLLLDLLSSNFLGYLLNAVIATVLLFTLVRLLLPILTYRGARVRAPPAARSPG